MKRIILLLLFIVMAFESQAQLNSVKNEKFSVELANNTVRSIYGWKSGPKIGLNFNGRIQVNYVYLMDISGSENVQDTFHGTQVKYYFNPKGKLNVGLGLRLGLYSEQFAAVIPSVDLKYSPLKDLNISLGVARLDRYPYFDLSIGYKVFKK